MGLSYDVFTGSFLSKVAEYEFINLEPDFRTEVVDGYMKRAIVAFKKNCKYDLVSSANDQKRKFKIDIASEDLDELVDIISEGMVVQWLKPYVYKQENLENAISTKDFSVYSPAELLLRIGNAYAKAQKDFTQAIREYSYNHGDLASLHS